MASCTDATTSSRSCGASGVGSAASAPAISLRFHQGGPSSTRPSGSRIRPRGAEHALVAPQGRDHRDRPVVRIDQTRGRRPAEGARAVGGQRDLGGSRQGDDQIDAGQSFHQGGEVGLLRDRRQQHDDPGTGIAGRVHRLLDARDPRLGIPERRQPADGREPRQLRVGGRDDPDPAGPLLPDQGPGHPSLVGQLAEVRIALQVDIGEDRDEVALQGIHQIHHLVGTQFQVPGPHAQGVELQQIQRPGVPEVIVGLQADQQFEAGLERVPGRQRECAPGGSSPLPAALQHGRETRHVRQRRPATADIEDRQGEAGMGGEHGVRHGAARRGGQCRDLGIDLLGQIRRRFQIEAAVVVEIGQHRLELDIHAGLAQAVVGERGDVREQLQSDISRGLAGAERHQLRHEGIEPGAGIEIRIVGRLAGDDPGHQGGRREHVLAVEIGALGQALGADEAAHREQGLTARRAADRAGQARIHQQQEAAIVAGHVRRQDPSVGRDHGHRPPATATSPCRHRQRR
ncbi:MAG: hypothetical protein U5R48_00370 [Gammaproteobacteria bacterium]|nr:hypothetical protein [Gammaproteobacteria bacterium]